MIQTINRYRICMLQDNSLSIELLLSKNRFPIAGIAFFLGFSAFLFYKTWKEVEIKITVSPFELAPFYGGILMLVIASIGIGRYYLTFNRRWMLTSQFLIMKTVFRKTTLIDKSSVNHFYVKKIEVHDVNLPNKLTSYHFEIWIDANQGKRATNFVLFELDTKDNLAGIYGSYDSTDIISVEEQAFEICTILNDHWNKTCPTV